MPGNDPLDTSPVTFRRKQLFCTSSIAINTTNYRLKRK
jgi:hypothetical protein